MHVDGALVDIDVAAPHAVEQLLAREDAARALHQELQQLELGRAEMELACRARRTRWVSRSSSMSPAASRFATRPRLGAPQERADPRQQLRHRERLGDVVVGAGREAAHAVALLAARGQHDDRQALGLAARAGSGGRPRCRRAPAASSRAGRGRAPVSRRRARPRRRGRRRRPRSPPPRDCSAAGVVSASSSSDDQDARRHGCPPWCCQVVGVDRSRSSIGRSSGARRRGSRP